MEIIRYWSSKKYDSKNVD